MYNDLDDKVITDGLEKAITCQDFIESKAGQLLKEACDRTWEKALWRLCYKTDIKDIGAIANLLATIKKNKWELFQDIMLLGQEGELLFEEAKYRDILNTSNPDEKKDNVNKT